MEEGFSACTNIAVELLNYRLLIDAYYDIYAAIRQCMFFAPKFMIFIGLIPILRELLGS